MSEDKERTYAGPIIRCTFCGVQATGPEASNAGKYCSLGCFAADRLRIIIISTAICLSLSVVLIYNANFIILIAGLLLLIAGIFFAFLTIVGIGSRSDRDYHRDSKDAMD